MSGKVSFVVFACERRMYKEGMLEVVAGKEHA